MIFFLKANPHHKILRNSIKVLNSSTPSKGFFGLFVSVPVELCVIKILYSLGPVDLILNKIPKA